jgi:very-short-patch-repair endonuclease
MLVPIRRDVRGRSTVLVPEGFAVFPPLVAELGGRPIEEYVAERFVSEGLPSARLEFRFFPPRRWRFDIAWPAERIALEIDGGIYSGGRHTRGAGFEGDCRKMNAAVSSGWRVFRVTPTMLANEWTEVVRVLRAAFEMRCDG